MCGICGVLYFDNKPVDDQILKDMVRVLSHRGPDNTGIYLAHKDNATHQNGWSGIGLGHTRLKVIDMSALAHQPMTNPQRSDWIVFNGEIYNYRKLKKRLEDANQKFRTESDTEVLLNLYGETGSECVTALDGMFAFAIWDNKRRRLFLANDRAGKKPIFYYHDQHMFAFASEMKALLQHPGIKPTINTAAIPSFFLRGYYPTPTTPYHNIHKLPPSHAMTIDTTGTINTQQYWDLQYSDQRPKELVFGGSRNSTQKIAGEVRDLFTEAVQKRLVADVPLGAFLSGGIDSSIVVGVMSQLLNRPVKTFSIGFAGDAAYNETSYARLVAKHFQSDHTEFIVEPQAIGLIEKLVWHHDGPFGDASAIPTYLVSQLSREHVTVVLTGDGGDEVFAGYNRFYASLIAEYIPKSAATIAQWLLSNFRAKNYGSWSHKAARFFQSAALPLPLRCLKLESIFFADLPTLLNRDLRQSATESSQSYIDELLGQSRASKLSRLLFQDFRTYLLDDLLVKMDRTAMANSLEARSPFLDTKLIEYTAGLPDYLKINRRQTKYILRRAFSAMLPKAIMERGKMGFGVPLGSWFRKEWREYTLDTLCNSRALHREYLDYEYVVQLVDDHMKGRGDLGLRLWTLLTFETWLQMLGGHTSYTLSS